MKQKILLIGYHYPPSMAVGGLRLANFARYLPSHGWQPYVLTIKDRYLEQVDHSRLAGLEHAPVYKVSKMPTLSDLYLAMKMKFQWHSRQQDTIRAGRQPGGGPARDGRPGSESARQRLKRYAFSLLLSLPDGERNWVIPAALYAMRIIRKERITCILTSCPPYSVHLIGWAVKLFTGVRWVSDFRDPWITGSRKRLYYTSRLSMAIEKVLERQVLRKSDRVLVNTAILTGLLKETYGDIDARKFIQLPNGFNPERFAKYRQLKKFEPFTITYTGSLYFGRTPEPLFAALKSLIDARVLRSDQVKVKLVGQCSQIDGRSTSAVVGGFGLDDVVEVVPPVSHDEAMTIVGRSHLALLLAPDQPYQIPAKVYDYLGTDTPILALAGEGATADIIRSTGRGEVFSPDDADGIAAALVRLFSRATEVREEIEHHNLRRFDIRHIVSELAGHLDSVCWPDVGLDRQEKPISLYHAR